ncbi:CzcE family metal-binding protein [Janthinobacterium agaricidamnosum]|nr:CzcE family metal-binding protein [Janthinobacterium agaricidamnosum]
MFTRLSIAAAAALLSSAMLLPGAQAAGPTGTAADFGSLVSDSTPARQITIDAQTRSVNVKDGETVKFNVGGKSFVWHFETFHDALDVDLSLIAPAGIKVDGIVAYIAANPLYRG